MPEPQLPSDAPLTTAERRGIRWDALAAIIAAMIGLLSLVVAGYTAWVQRLTANIQAEQVRAQVWPWLLAGNNDLKNSIEVYNKGVGPAIVRSAQMWVDGKPQADWNHLLDALGVAKPRTYSESTIYPNVLSAGETVSIIKFAEGEVYQRFRSAAVQKHLTIAVCFCSTLGECWRYWDNHLVGYKEGAVQVRQVRECPRIAPGEVFNN